MNKTDHDILNCVQKMCEESLDPSTFEKWEGVKDTLYKNRSSLQLLVKVQDARCELDKAVENNFGFVGNDVCANKALDCLQSLEQELREQYPDKWEVYSSKYY